HPAVMAEEQVGVGLEELEHFGKAVGGEVVVAADARALLEMDGRGEAVRGEHLARDLERLLEADWPAQAVRADLQEDLVGNVVIRGAEKLDEDLRKRTRLSVNVDRLESLGYGSGRDLTLHAAAGPLDESGDQFAGILQAYRRVLAQADAAASLRSPQPELVDRERGDRGLLLGGVHLLAATHGVDTVEIHRQRGVQGIVGAAGVLDARDAEVRRVVARV